eukprot:767174-Hanusia_phi.AAC.4
MKMRRRRRRRRRRTMTTMMRWEEVVVVEKGVQSVLDPDDFDLRVVADRLKAAAKVCNLLEHDALPHQVDETRHVAHVAPRELLDGPVDALEAGPLDA